VSTRSGYHYSAGASASARAAAERFRSTVKARPFLRLETPAIRPAAGPKVRSKSPTLGSGNLGTIGLSKTADGFIRCKGHFKQELKKALRLTDKQTILGQRIHEVDCINLALPRRPNY